MKYLLILFLFIAFSSYAQDRTECVVTYIVDGDTFKCITNGSEQTVRLIGIDAPESRMNRKTKSDLEKTGMDYKTLTNMGKQSTKFVKEHMKLDDRIQIETDMQATDNSGRVLAYVYLSDGTMLNELLVKEGYANVATYPPNVKYKELFIEKQREARENKKGLWGE